MAKPSHKDRLITFLSTLSSELNDLHHDNMAKQYAINRFQQRCRKKALITKSGLETAAFDLFKSNNDYVARHQITLSDQHLALAREFIQHALWRYAKFLDPDDVQCDLYTPQLFELWRFGPGASNGVVGTHTAEKLQQPMTCTSSVEPLVQILRKSNPYLSCYDAANGGGTRVVDGSKMTTVPKNEDAVRVIAIEPSGNMALQLAAGYYLEGTLRGIGLDIKTQQPKNKALARIGSIYDSLATVDMKSASDLISPHLIKLLLPAVWYKLLMRLRSPSTVLPSGERLELNMISTMGNGFTFPLMTLVLLALVYANRCVLKPQTRRNYIDWSCTAVFGDDVIVPVDEYNSFVDICTACGFIVNTDKSYSVGPFRESCGGDYYLGYDCTPVYVKSLTTNPEIYIAINQLCDWCGKHQLSLIRSIKLLVSYIDGPLFFVPEWSDAFAGIKTSQCPRSYKMYAIKQQYKRLKDSRFAMMLACGGYIEHGRKGDDLFYIPRIDSPRYVVVKRRIPSGYVDGSCALTRNESSTNWIALLMQFV